MCEEGIGHESERVLICESGSPPVEGEGHKEGHRVSLMEDRGEVGRQG